MVWKSLEWKNLGPDHTINALLKAGFRFRVNEIQSKMF